MLFNEMSLTEQELAKYENQATIDSQLAADVRGTYMSYLCRSTSEFLVKQKKRGGGVSCTRDNTSCNKLFHCYSLIVGYSVKNQNFISILFSEIMIMLKKNNGHFIFIVMFILQALGKADGAKNTAKKVSDDVTKALETVTNISTLLGMY